MEVTNASLTAIRTMVSDLFQQARLAAGRERKWMKVATRVPSTTRSNTYDWLGDFPHLTEDNPGTVRAYKAMKEHAYALVNKLNRSATRITVPSIEDDQLGTYTPLIRIAGREVEVSVDRSVFGLLKNGRTGLCYDGKPFFATDHPVAANVDGTGANTPTSNIYMPGETGHDEWYLLAGGMDWPLQGLIFQERVMPEVRMITDPEHPRVFDYDEVPVGIRARRAYGYGFWQQAISSRAELTHESFIGAYAQLAELEWDGGNPTGLEPACLVVRPKMRAIAEGIANSAIVLESKIVKNVAGDENVGGTGAAVSNVNRGIVEVVQTPFVK